MRPLHTFPGGLHLPAHKAESTALPIAVAPLPRELVIPVQQHIGQAATPLVKVGDRVLKGQMIAKPEGYVSVPIHASSSGTVIAVEKRPVPHPSHMDALCVVIETDGADRWIERTPHPDWPTMDPSHLRNLVREAGVVGLGGAGFPSYIKLNPGPQPAIETLLLNGAECEPYISCDDMFMRERADEVIAGLRIMAHALQSERNLIAIEDNKPHAIAAMQQALERARTRHAAFSAEVVVVPTRYPTGGARQLIQVVTGIEVPSGMLSMQMGVVCYNVATAAAIHRAIDFGEPLISRVVTVTGGAVARPRNFDTRIGTPMDLLLEHAGGTRAALSPPLMGGPMMGITLQRLDLPVIKTTNCLLVPAPDELGGGEAPLPCIRCGACAEVCPVRLQPQQIYWHAMAREFDKAQEHKLFDCIECGCCAYVCPSRLPLVQYYRFAKSAIDELEQAHAKADVARQRHEFRLQRHDREKAEREARLREKHAAADDPKKAAIQAALERANAKKAERQRNQGKE